MCILLVLVFVVMLIWALPVLGVLMGLVYGWHVIADSRAKKQDRMFREADAQRPPIPGLFPAEGALNERFQATGEIGVAYSIDFAVAWRCSLYTLGHKAAVWMPSLLVGVMVSGMVAFYVPLEFPISARWGIIGLKFGVALLGWVGLNVLGLWLQVLAQFPGGGNSIRCSTRLARRGFENWTGEKASSPSWVEVTEVREYRGNLYIWADRGGANPSRGFFVPREAFGSEEERECFGIISMRLWKSGGEAWGEELPQGSKAWKWGVDYVEM